MYSDAFTNYIVIADFHPGLHVFIKAYVMSEIADHGVCMDFIT